jgi:hypothetical protein
MKGFFLNDDDAVCNVSESMVLYHCLFVLNKINLPLTLLLLLFFFSFGNFASRVRAGSKKRLGRMDESIALSPVSNILCPDCWPCLAR